MVVHSAGFLALFAALWTGMPAGSGGRTSLRDQRARSRHSRAGATKRTMRLHPPVQFRILGAEGTDRTDLTLPHSHVSAIVQDERGFLWLGTQGGLARYDGHEIMTYRFDPKEASSLS